MAGVQAHMKSFYPLSGSGRCAPTLLEDLTLYSPLPPSREGYNLLRDSPLNFTHGQNNGTPTLGALLHPATCRHVFWLKPRQSILPALDERAGPHSIWSIGAVCGKCRTHLNVKIDYSDGWMSAPCPNPENPLHHFIRAEWREGMETRRWEDTMLGSECQITVLQCSADECSATLTVRYTPPVLGDEIVHALTDRDLLKQRTDAAFQLNEGNTQGMKPPAVIEVLSDLRIYIANAWNKQQTRRDIKMSNRRFVVRFGPNGDACRDILEFLRFRRDETNQCWHVPEPNAEDLIPLQDPINIFLDDAEHELLALMITRPPTEVSLVNDLRGGPLATRDLQRLVGAQDYDTTLFSRTAKADPSLRQVPYIGLGIPPDAADNLVRYAYNCQTRHDPRNVPYYFQFLRDIALERRSDLLQTEVGVQESLGRYSAAALEHAFATFGISRHDNLDDDNIIGMFQSRLMDMPAHEGDLRQNLRIIGQARNSQKILAIADNVMDTHDQALQFLGADSSVSDDHIQALFTVKVAENKQQEEQARKAVRLIAAKRDSKLLNKWINSGFVGDLNMDATDGYQALELDNREVEDEIVMVAYDFKLSDQPDDREYWMKALEAIANDRNSSVLKDHLQSSIPAGAVLPGNIDEPVGLDNIGNTCYLNSLLQFLFTVAELRKIVLDFDKYKMEISEDNLAQKKVGQRKVSKREVQTAQDFVTSLGRLFNGMIETAASTIKPEKELARLTLETHGAKEKLRRRSTLMSDRPSLGHIDSHPVIQATPVIDEEGPSEIMGPATMRSATTEESDTIMVDDKPLTEATSATPDQQLDGDNSSEATLVSKPGTPVTPPPPEENFEQQKELLDNKENLSPTKLDTSPKRGDVEMEHPEPLAPASPSKVNSQAGALADQMKAKQDRQQEEHLIEATPIYAPPPGKPPPVPPRRPIEPTTDILEEYARQQDVTEVLAHCLFQFSCAMRGTGTDGSGEQVDEVHDIFFGQNVSHTVPEKEPPHPIPFNNIITRVANKPKDVYDALDSEYDLSEREGGSKAFMSISKLPPVFSMALDRVAWDKVAKKPKKQDDHVQVPETIFLDRYLETEPDSDLMRRREQAWLMKSELSSLIKRRDRLEEKVANGRNVPTLFADAKLALEYLQANPDFTTPNSESDDELAQLLDPSAINLLGALADDLAAELSTINDRVAHIEQQLKEAFADMRKHPYRLHAAFFHRGGASGGHYWVYIYDHKKECWRRYNDDRVNIVENRNEIFGKPDTVGNTPNPYFLVYVREDQISSLVETVKREISFAAPLEPPPNQQWSGVTSWTDQVSTSYQPQSQVEAMPPGGDREMMEVNGGINAWGGEYSDPRAHDYEPSVPEKHGDWDSSELITSRKVNWSG